MKDFALKVVVAVVGALIVALVSVLANWATSGGLIRSIGGMTPSEFRVQETREYHANANGDRTSTPTQFKNGAFCFISGIKVRLYQDGRSFSLSTNSARSSDHLECSVSQQALTEPWTVLIDGGVSCSVTCVKLGAL